MTLDEAKKVGAIVARADGGCCVCVQNLVECLNEDFPEFEWEMQKTGNFDILVVVKGKP